MDTILLVIGLIIYIVWTVSKAVSSASKTQRKEGEHHEQFPFPGTDSYLESEEEDVFHPKGRSVYQEIKFEPVEGYEFDFNEDETRGENTGNELATQPKPSLGEFFPVDLKTAVVYSEILKPKYQEE